MPTDGTSANTTAAFAAPEIPVWRPSRKPAAVSLAISILIHSALVVTGLFVVWTVTLPKREVKPEITVSFFDPAPGGVVLTESDPSNSTPSASALPAATAIKTSDLSERIAALDPTASSASQSPAPPGLSRAQRDELMNARKFPEVRFQGLGSGNAQSIVYVVDAAGSMITTLDRVKDDLKRSILKLAPTQQFQVVFFKSGTRFPAPHPSDTADSIKAYRLIRATRENVRSVIAWIDSISPGGTGNMMVGLDTAIRFQPDAIFLLSSLIPGSGEWKPDKAQILAQLETLNPRDPSTGRRNIVIKTIQYLDPDPQGILEAIAAAHGPASTPGGASKDGYVFIPRSDSSK